MPQVLTSPAFPTRAAMRPARRFVRLRASAMTLALGFIATCPLGLVGSAHAQPAPGHAPVAEDAAMAVLKLARHHYQAGEYAKAAGLFHQAWQIDPKPAFLFNAARAEQRAFQHKKAIADFDKLLQLPGLDAEVAKRSRTHRKECAELLARDQARATPGEAMKGQGTPIVPPAMIAQNETGGAANWPVYAGLGGAALLGAGAAVLWAMAAGDRQALQDQLNERDASGKTVGTTRADALAQSDDISTLEVAAASVAGVALVSAGVGVWLWLRQPAAGGQSARLDVGLGRLALRVDF